MRFEVKTNQNRISNELYFLIFIFMAILLSTILANISFNLSKLSRYYEINYLCKLILVDKSSNNFKKLIKLTNQSNKQRIWDLCREYSK